MNINFLSAIANAIVGKGRASANGQAPGGLWNEGLVTELAPRFYAMAKSNLVFTAAVAGANPTAFTGGAAGTPLIGLYNPASSGVDLVILQARVGVRTTGTAAVAVDLNFWGVNQGGVAVTGTNTAPYNVYSQAQTGSVATAMLNVANTAALASTLRAASVSIGLTPATSIMTPGIFVDPVDGAIIVSPGSYLAYGASGTLTAASLDVSLLWAELPV